MSDKILAILEQRDGKLKKVSFETAGAVSKLAADLGLEAEAVAVGNEIENLNEIAKYGIKKVIHLKNENLLNYSSSAYADAISDYSKEVSAKYLLFPNTSLGKDLAPRVAVKINSGILMDCVKLDSSSKEIIATRPIYAGKALMDAKLKTEIKTYTIRPNVFKPTMAEDTLQAEVSVKEISNPNLKT
ncbi:MAG: electron transfer flavoprotein subunit alpha/FixB family protein, partial [Ignavibacteriaceae bacterium]